jgi:predicted small metal-binding protein
LPATLLQRTRQGAHRQSPRRPEKEAEMPKIINCECGYVAHGETDDEVLADLETHIRRDHPEMVGKYKREEMLDLIEEA